MSTAGPEPEDDVPRARRAAQADLTDRCVSVVLGADTYGIPIRDVQEIIAARPLSRVFRAPAAIAGVTSLRGEILPVIDLALLLGGAPGHRPDPDGLRIVVVREAGGLRRRAGLRVDALGPVRELPAGGLDPPPATLGAGLRPFVRGVIPEAPVCAVLDVLELLDAPELGAIAGEPSHTPAAHGRPGAGEGD